MNFENTGYRKFLFCELRKYDMKNTLIFYRPEFYQAAIELRDNYIAHHGEQVDIISETEQDDIEYARKNNYSKSIFIEDLNAVIISDIKTGYTNSYPISKCFIEN